MVPILSYKIVAFRDLLMRNESLNLTDLTVFAVQLFAVRASVDGILASVNAQRDQTTTKPAPKQADDPDSNPCQQP